MKTIKIKARGTLALLFALLLVVLSPSAAFAATGDTTDGVSFYVSAHIPSNQIDTSLSYFDLKMQTSDTQTLAVSIVNTGTEEITVEVSAISASTNQNGLIDYRTPDIRDESLTYPFSELASVHRSEITIAANSTEIAYIDLEMPALSYDGVILGGIVIAQKDEELTDESTESTSAVLNNYAYVLGVKLTETDTVVEPTFALLDVAAEAVDYRPAMVHYLRNEQAVIVKNMNASMTLRALDANEALYENEWVIDMAPNSVIHLPAFLESGELQAGEYLSQITLEHEGNVTVLEYRFTVENNTVNVVNDLIIEESSSIPLWAWIIIALLIIIVLLIFILLLLFQRRKDEEEEKYENTKQFEDK